MNPHSLSDDQVIEVLWNFNTQLNAPQKADIILVLGSNDIRSAHKGAELFKDGFAPYILFSGNLGKLTRNLWTEPEAEVFAEEALKIGVPKEKILIENRSTNTSENIDFSLEILRQKNMHPHSFLVVQKPYMLQRTLATFRKKLPDVSVTVACADLSFQEYPNAVLEKKYVMNIVVGDMQRLMLYPQKGFQVEVDIPEEVIGAYDELVRRGYTEHLLTEQNL